jgi:hypothetical protein
MHHYPRSRSIQYRMQGYQIRGNMPQFTGLLVSPVVLIRLNIKFHLGGIFASEAVLRTTDLPRHAML